MESRLRRARNKRSAKIVRTAAPRAATKTGKHNSVTKRGKEGRENFSIRLDALLDEREGILLHVRCLVGYFYDCIVAAISEVLAMAIELNRCKRIRV